MKDEKLMIWKEKKVPEAQEKTRVSLINRSIYGLQQILCLCSHPLTRDIPYGLFLHTNLQNNPQYLPAGLQSTLGRHQ